MSTKYNSKGPAVTNKEMELVEYYLYGVKLSKDIWAKRIKSKSY